MKVFIPSPLHAYTGGLTCVDANGNSLAKLLEDLDRRHPGLRFRIIDEQDRVREHIRLFIGNRAVTSLATALKSGDEIHILAALSGG